MLPRLTGDRAARLRDALCRAGYHRAGVSTPLGEQAHDALVRGEPVPALRASAPGADGWIVVRELVRHGLLLPAGLV